MLHGNPDFGRIGQRCSMDCPDICLLAVVLKDVYQFAVCQAFAHVPLRAQQDATAIAAALDNFSV